ncbi:MAG: YHS domain-containing protein, partial [Actinomycetota bacterium]
AAATERNDGEEYFFCAPRCAERFAGDPQRFLGAAEPKGMDETMPGTQHLGLSIGRKTQLDETEETDPVCSMRVKPESAAGYADYETQRYYFCGLGCRERFLADPSSFLTQSAT